MKKPAEAGFFISADEDPLLKLVAGAALMHGIVELRLVPVRDVEFEEDTASDDSHGEGTPPASTETKPASVEGADTSKGEGDKAPTLEELLASLDRDGLFAFAEQERERLAAKGIEGLHKKWPNDHIRRVLKKALSEA
jgi:hypothetical protein